MQKNYKNFLIISLITFLFLLSSFSSAAMPIEISLPGLPSQPQLPDYLKYLFNFGMMIAGAVTLLAIIWGGIRYLTSAGNPETMGEAKKRIFGGIIGLVILFSSYLIIYNINPQLITNFGGPQQLTAYPSLYLLWSSSGTVVKKETSPGNISDIDRLYTPPDKPPDAIGYKCEIKTDPNTGQQIKIGPPVEVYFYPEINYGGVPTKKKMLCEESSSITIPSSAKSFSFNFIYPGVKFYSEKNCTGEESDFYTASLVLPGKWKNNIKSIKIINGSDSVEGPFYGVMIHGYPNFRGDTGFYGPCKIVSKPNPLHGGSTGCQLQVGSSSCVAGEERCWTRTDNQIATGASSATIYRWAKKPIGDGVILYTLPFFKGGQLRIKNSDIEAMSKNNIWYCNYLDYHNGQQYLGIPIKPDWTDSGVPIERQELCPNGFQKNGKWICLSSIEILGDYLIYLNDATGAWVFDSINEGQLFPYGTQSKGPSNLPAEWINTGFNVDPDEIFIIPIKK